MGAAKTTCGLAFLLTVALLATVALAGSVLIEQVPGSLSPVGKDETLMEPSDDRDGSDYQNEVLSNPVYSAPARANAIMDGNIGGNTAVIVQEGKSNTSSIVQEGADNYARQSQKGISNDIKVEQKGRHNRSDEKQTGNYNHKLKIQNEDREETLIIEQVFPETDKP